MHCSTANGRSGNRQGRKHSERSVGFALHARPCYNPDPVTFVWTSPLGPVFLLVAGALLLVAGGRHVRRWPLLPVGIAGLTLLDWLVLRGTLDRAQLFWSWSAPLSLPTVLGLELPGEAWVVGLVILLLLPVLLVAPGWEVRPGFADPRAWALLLVGAALLVLMAGNWLTLLPVWTALGMLMGLVIGAPGAGRVWAWAMFSGLAMMAAPLFNGGRSLEMPLATAVLNAQAQWLVIVAAAIPLATYPFHLWLSGIAATTTTATARLTAGHLVPTLAILALLRRLDLSLLASQLWVPLGAMALLGSALAAWACRREGLSMTLLGVNRATWAMLVMGLEPSQALLLVFTLGLGTALWWLGHWLRRHMGWRWPLGLAVAVLVGMPFTPGFAPTLTLARLTAVPVGVFGWLAVLVGQSLLVATLLRQFAEAALPEPMAPTAMPSSASQAMPSAPRSGLRPWGPVRWRGRELLLIRLGALILTAGLTLAYALHPGILVVLGGTDVETTGISRQGSALTLPAQAGWGGWLTLVLPLGMGWLLSRHDERWFGSLQRWRETVGRVATLNWLSRGLGRVGHYLVIGLGYGADLVDGAGQFGYVLLVILLAWLLLRG